MEYTTQEFYDLATKEFGEKFTIKTIQMSDEDLVKFNTEFNCNVTINEIQEYEQVWLLEDKCPQCGSELFGLFGSFTWEIVHGIGHCSECKSVQFRYYHYIGDCKSPIKALSIVGF